MMFSGIYPEDKRGLEVLRKRLLQAGAAKVPQVLTFGHTEGGKHALWVERFRELAELIGRVVHPSARLVFDADKPDGTPRKLLDLSRLHALGWRHRIELEQGIAETYQWFLAQSAVYA